MGLEVIAAVRCQIGGYGDDEVVGVQRHLVWCDEWQFLCRAPPVRICLGC